MKKYFYIFNFLFLFHISCGGSVSTIGSGNSDLALDIINQQNTANDVVMLASDYSSSSQLLFANESGTQLINTGVTLLGSDANLKIYDEEIYILNHGFSRVSSENLQIIDPQSGFSTSLQISTGNGTNPQDFIIRDRKAFISLYNPELSNDNFLSSNKIDLIILDLDQGGSRIGSISFQDHLNDDDSKTARAACMIESDDFIYVCIQDLQDGNGRVFFPNTAGKIARVDPDTFEYEVFELQGRNPLDIEYSSITKKLYIAHLAYQQNIETDFGGIEVLDESKIANSTYDINQDSQFISDNDFGGYTERLSVNDNKIFVVASDLDAQSFQLTSQVLSANLNFDFIDDFETIIDDGEDIREIMTDSQNRLWIGARQLSARESQAELPQVYVYDLNQNQILNSPLTPEVPVVSIAVGDL